MVPTQTNDPALLGALDTFNAFDTVDNPTAKASNVVRLGDCRGCG